MAGLHDGQCRRHRHDRIEVPRAVAMRQVAETVRLPGIDQRDIAENRVFQQAVAAVDDPGFASLGQDRVGAGRCVKRLHPGARPPVSAPPRCPAARSPVPARRPRTGGRRRCRPHEAATSLRIRPDGSNSATGPSSRPPEFATSVRSRAPCATSPFISVSACRWRNRRGAPRPHPLCRPSQPPHRARIYRSCDVCSLDLTIRP